jgi:hypothetical protein
MEAREMRTVVRLCASVILAYPLAALELALYRSGEIFRTDETLAAGEVPGPRFLFFTVWTP